MRARSSAPIKLRADERKIAGHLAGQIVAVTRNGLVVTHAYCATPTRARSTIPLSDALRAQVAKAPIAALLVFEEERSDRPIVVGLLDPPPSSTPAPPAGALQAEARVDGARVVLAAQDEIVLSCGKASITLRRNGRVSIQGAYVETRSEGVNRIKGGSVQIN